MVCLKKENCWHIHSGLISLLLILISFRVTAQHAYDIAQLNQRKLKLENKVDSLKNCSFSTPYGEIKNIRNIIDTYMDFNLDSALTYSNKELALARRMQDMEQLAYARINASNVLNQLGKFQQARQVLLANLAEKDKISDTLIASTQSALSNVQISTEEYHQSISSALAAAETFEELKDSNNAGFAYITVAEVYQLALDSTQQAITYIQKAIRFLNAKSASKEHLIAALLTYGDIHANQNNYTNALTLYTQAEQLATHYNEYWLYPDIMIKLGKVYYFKEEYKKSISYLDKAQYRFEGNGTSEASRYEYLGLNYKALNQPEKAISYFNLCLQYESTPRVLNYYREYLIECYIALGDYESAFALQKEVMAYKDTLNAAKQKEKVAEIVEKYDNEKKQQEINLLTVEKSLQENQIRQQQFILYGIIAFFILVIGFGFFLYRTRSRLKETNQNLETSRLQQRFLRTQLNPHFFFHALTSIESYIYSNDKEQAASFLRNFSKLMRNILEFSDVNFITLKQDVDFIKKYIELQNLNHDFKFTAQINVADEIDQTRILVPPMLIQPAVENAILHGALKTEKGAIMINYSLTQAGLKITISDNGKSTAQQSHSPDQLNRSMSTDITVSRIKTIKEVDGIEILYQSYFRSENQEGSTVIFNIPQNFRA